jgi:hypothetical protein
MLNLVEEAVCVYMEWFIMGVFVFCGCDDAYLAVCGTMSFLMSVRSLSS